jgi:hypothetical protein
MGETIRGLIPFGSAADFRVRLDWSSLDQRRIIGVSQSKQTNRCSQRLSRERIGWKNCSSFARGAREQQFVSAHNSKNTPDDNQ